jgi:hypothetical protein
MAQSQYGKIRIFEDFIGGEDIVANTAASRTFGAGGLRVIGEGIAENDSGVTILESDGLNGVGVLTTTDEAAHTCGLATGKIFDVALNGPLVAECRVQFADLDTKSFFFGFASENDDAETEVASGATSTITLTAASLVGFLLDHSLTEDELWHMIYNGGTTTGATASGSVDSAIDAVAGEYDILRVEIDPNGTARWYIDGALKQTVEGAVSTSTDLAGLALVNAHGAEIEYAYLDYVAFEANRDWTV